MATFAVPGDQLLSVTGRPTGLARPSVPIGEYPSPSVNLVDGALVSFEQIYRTQIWVAVNVHKIVRQISRLPLKAYKKNNDGDRERIASSAYLPRLLSRPFPQGGATHFKQSLALSALVNGNSALMKERDRPGGPVKGFRPLVWSMLTAWRDPGAPVAFWESSQPGVPRVIDPSDVIHVGWRGLTGPIGVTPLEQLGTTIAVEEAAARHQQSMLRNGARPPSAMTASDAFLGIERADRQALMTQLRADVDTIYGGPNNSGKPAVLPPGIDWKSVGHSAVEAELISQRKLTREEVAACYDIPPPLIGILEYATLANVAEAHRMLYTTILAPWLNLIEETLQAQLIDPEPSLRGDIYVEFDLSEVLKGDLLQRAQALALQISHGILTIDEAREIENRPKFELPVTERPLYPSNNLQPVPDDLPVAEEPPSGSGGGDDPAPPDPEEPSDDDVQQAATLIATMPEDPLRRVLRNHCSVVDAIMDYTKNGHQEGSLA